jgi:TM2 domain-containing membrane protein YozV
MAKKKIQSKSKVVAGLLAIFLGGIGIHKFYLGRVGWGLIYILFSWTCIPIFLGVMEGLIYLGMSDKSFEAKYS